MAQDVDLVKLAETVGAAAAEASNNSKSLIAMHKPIRRTRYGPEHSIHTPARKD
jgi:hypothetical protein